MSLFDRIIAIFRGSASAAPEELSEKPKKIVSTMFNSLTLSSDMQTLYLIDNGRSFDFSLDSKNGIIVGILDGQITVATARRLPVINGDGMNFSAASRMSVPPEKVRLDLEDSQYTLFFNIDHEIVGIIGATEIEESLENDDDNIKTSVLVYRLKDFTVNIKRKGSFIEVVRIEVQTGNKD